MQDFFNNLADDLADNLFEAAVENACGPLISKNESSSSSSSSSKKKKYSKYDYLQNPNPIPPPEYPPTTLPMIPYQYPPNYQCNNTYIPPSNYQYPPKYQAPPNYQYPPNYAYNQAPYPQQLPPMAPYQGNIGSYCPPQ